MALDLINPIDRDALRQQYQSAKPVPWFKIDNFLKSDFADRCAAAFPTYEDVARVGKTWNNVNERGKYQVTDASLFPPPLKQLQEMMASQEFLDLIEHVTGIPRLLADDRLVGGGLHATGPRGHLDVHLDFDYIQDRQLHRRLNILVYLNKDWKPEWGGEFELWDPEVKVCQQKFSPVFNRCVMFETNHISYHGVNAVTCPPGEFRRSFAAYYYTTEAPAHWTGTPHDTIFKARPDEKLKAVQMKAEKVTGALGDLLRRGARKIKKTIKGG